MNIIRKDNVTDSVLTTPALKYIGIKHVVCKARDDLHKTVRGEYFA